MGSDLWTRENLAWVAGIIEGEGYIGARTLNSSKSVGLQIQVSMSDQDVITQLCYIAGCGNVTGPFIRKKNPTHKPIWNYGVYGKDAYAVLTAIIPWLGERRTAAACAAIKSWLRLPGRGVLSRKLTDDQVREIRRAVNVAGRPIRDVAIEFGSNHHSVLQIARGHYYKTVPDHAS